MPDCLDEGRTADDNHARSFPLSLLNLVYMRYLTSTDAIRAAFPAITNFSDIGHTHNFISLGFEVFDCICTIKGLADFFKRSASSLNEEEVYRHKLNNEPAFEEEVEPPGTCFNPKRNGVLRKSEADVCCKALQEQTICTNLEAENFERI